MAVETELRKLNRFEWLIFLLSIYVVVELYLELLFRFTEKLATAAEVADFAICLVFLGDFFWRLAKAPQKGAFLRRNWIDFVSSIPMVGVLRIGRAARIFRVLRLVRSGRVFYSLLDRHKAVNTFQSVVVMTVVVVLLAAVAIVRLEQGASPFFASFGNSLWWCTVTTVTLGFLQDVAPVTPEGKLVSVFLIGSGIVLVGTFTAMVADYFIGDEEIVARLQDVEKRLQRIEEKLDRALGGDDGAE